MRGNQAKGRNFNVRSLSGYWEAGPYSEYVFSVHSNALDADEAKRS